MISFDRHLRQPVLSPVHLSYEEHVSQDLNQVVPISINRSCKLQHGADTGGELPFSNGTLCTLDVREHGLLVREQEPCP